MAYSHFRPAAGLLLIRQERIKANIPVQLLPE